MRSSVTARATGSGGHHLRATRKNEVGARPLPLATLTTATLALWASLVFLASQKRSQRLPVHSPVGYFRTLPRVAAL